LQLVYVGCYDIWSNDVRLSDNRCNYFGHKR